MEFNKYQSSLEELKFDTYPEEVQDEFFKYLNGVPFIRNLVSKDRPMIGDLPKDEKGRAIIDVTRPPIVTDTDYFRPMAIRFDKEGKYTDLNPNPNPNSAFGKLLQRELDRCWNGYTRPDGAWVSGDMYWYLNYCRIKITKKIEGSNIGNRVVDFPKFWEGMLWRTVGWELSRKHGNNYAEIAKRGASKSYSAAAKLAKDFIIGENEETQQNVSSMVMGTTKQYLTVDGTLNKFEFMIDFLARNTEFPSKRLTSSLHDMEYVMGYQDLNTNTKRGTLNAVYGLAIKDEPDKPRGKRMSSIIAEEFGNFPHLSEVYDITQKSIKDGDVTFGWMNLIGTGGSKGNNFAGALGMIYHPKGFGIEEFDNVWDISQQGKGKSIACFPAYVNRVGCTDKDGISDVTKALLAICNKRYIVKYNTDDPNKLTRMKAEDPITIQDAILKRDSTLFPVADLNERILEIDSNPHEYDDSRCGKMIQDKAGRAEWIPTHDVPIREFPHKDNKLKGAVEIFCMPKKGRDGKVFSNRYIAGNDPYDDDSSNTMSLGSTFILDLWTDEIVAEYTGRPLFADDYYEQVRLLLMFYNARMNYENNKKGLYGYFKKMNCSFLLTDELEFLKSRDNIGKEQYGNKLKGTNATTSVNNEGRAKLRDWLLEPKTVMREIDGKEQQVIVKNLQTVRNRALLEECAQWNPDGNFDRVSAMGMLMLLREDRLILFGKKPGQKSNYKSPDYKGNDPLFADYDRQFDPDRFKEMMKKMKKDVPIKPVYDDSQKGKLPYRI